MIGSERGTTITELIVVLAIIALITGILVTVIFQIYDITGWGNSELVVQHDLQNAATWLNRDVLTASRAEVSDSQMALSVPYFAGTFLTRTITYTHSAVDRTLIRYSGDSTITVARNVDSIAFSATGTVTSAIVITITSRASDVTQSTTLHLDMRPSR